jgi:hypothetical protein
MIENSFYGICMTKTIQSWAVRFVSLLLCAVGAILLSATPIYAQGEKYSVTLASTTDKAVITGSGGAYSSPATFIFTRTDNGNAIFNSQAQLACTSGQQAANVSLSVPESSLKTGTTAQGTITPDAAVACGAQLDGSPNLTIGSNKLTTNGKGCDGGRLGWIFCPLYEKMLDTITWVEQNAIIPFLRIDPIVTNQNTSTYQIWLQVKNISNLLFFVAFLVMVFSTVTSVGIDNYSLKRILPRLFAAAIGVQFSYWIVAFLVDFFNILGYGMNSLIALPLQQHAVFATTDATSALGLAGAFAGALFVTGGLLSGTLFISLIGAFFAIILVFFTLVARQILITFLIIVSPLAFAAWVLPNTANYFRFWYKSLTRLLIMYPLIVLLFASGKIFGAAAASTTGGGAGSTELRSLMSIVANVIPLFLIPATFKFAGSLMGSANSIIKGLHGQTRNATEKSSAYSRAKERTQQRRTELASGQGVTILGSKGRIGQNSRALTQLGRNPWDIGRGANIRAMTDFSKDRTAWGKRLGEEDMTFEGYNVLSKGEDWYKAEVSKAETKQTRAQNAGDTIQANAYAAQIDRLNNGHQEAKRYLHISAARTAAMKWLFDKDLGGEDDLKALPTYTGNTLAGDLISRQVWGQVKEGARKTNVHLAFTDINGNTDLEGLEGFVSKKNMGAWQDYSPDAVKVMYNSGILKRMASNIETRRTLRNILSDVGGPTIAADQQAHIRKVLQDTPLPTGANAKDIGLQNDLRVMP